MEKEKIIQHNRCHYSDKDVITTFWYSLQANEQQQLRVWRQRLGGGRVVTIVKGFAGNNKDLQALGKLLKTACSSGGTVKNGEVLIQGDHRDKIVNFLNDRGYKAKASGG